MSKPKFLKEGLLEISLNRNELLIVGNREGLSSFASLITYVANLAYQSEELTHEHVGFSWYKEILAGKLVIRLGKLPLTPPTKNRDGKGREVTIMLSKNLPMQRKQVSEL
jgi:hypothetical protein